MDNQMTQLKAINATSTRKKMKFSLYNVILSIFFIIMCTIVVIPLWKILIDSFDLHTAYGLKLIPKKFGFDGYISVFTNQTLYKPLMISAFTTIAGTFCGLAVATLGAYVLFHKDMPGNRIMAGYLLFTMIFSGGMIPSYLVLKSLHITDTLLAVILPPTVSIYNLVLMKNFFDGIPKSLFEAAKIDGSSYVTTFFKVVLPLSKAALASIGLMYAVTYWNEYTNYRLYITDSNLYNFQMKLYGIMQGSDLPQAIGSATENTVKNACIIISLLPFIVTYPFLQKYFVKGINVGAVKE